MSSNFSEFKRSHEFKLQEVVQTSRGNPEKLVMPQGFYSRAFKASKPKKS